MDAACASGEQQDMALECAVWTGYAGWITVERQGVIEGEGLRVVRRENGMAHNICTW